MTTEEKIELAILRGYACEPDTGKVFGLRGREIGKIASNGYIRIYFRDTDYKMHEFTAHQFIWYWVNKSLPPNVIDHINTDKLDNRISNLRDATYAINSLNRIDSKGYEFTRGKYRARIKYKGLQKHIGWFETAEEANRAYIEEKQKLINNGFK